MRTVIETITPEMAAAYLLRNKSNRKLSKPHVDSICRAILAGQFELTHQGIAFDERGNLIDGQHRLQAIVKSGMPVKMSVTYGVCSDSKMSIDAQMRPRSYADALAIEGDQQATKQSIATCKMWMVLIGSRRPNLFEVKDFYGKHAEAIRGAYRICGGHKILRHGCVLAMMAIAIEKGHEQEIIEWADAVRTGVIKDAWQTSATRFREWWLASPKNGGEAIRIDYCRRIYSSMDSWINRKGLSKLYARESIDWLKQ